MHDILLWEETLKWKREVVVIHIYAFPHISPWHLWWSCLCAGMSALAYPGDSWALSWGAREINVCSLTSYASWKPEFLCELRSLLYVLWGYSTSGVGSLAAMFSLIQWVRVRLRTGFLIISVGSCIQVPLPSFPLMHLVCPAWSDQSLQYRDAAVLSVSIS